MLALLGVVSPPRLSSHLPFPQQPPPPLAANNGSAFGGPLWEDAGSLVQMEGIQEMGQNKKE